MTLNDFISDYKSDHLGSSLDLRNLSRDKFISFIGQEQDFEGDVNFYYLLIADFS